ncbi:MAG: cysteine synthase A [Helicobacter sp.]|uniref:cysteine synthase n=1 Tax=Helicobacter bilis ATCC 43879 TaxID=613026 RepID=C3XFD6_9HELI|nr:MULTISPECIES: cysteine synthase A [Helicobacter]EEO23725.2 cysteine synthase A [Helicobacter bilis ATCC 43879]MDY5822219.1 cysteine synthase A [Helicobacter sp.]MDY5951048.1 cysteine synthase A [Helicobacter sp.]
MIAQNVTELIGKTPVIKLNKLSQKFGANIFGKCEFMNPNSSIKDRIAMAMIFDGMKHGTITQNTTIVEATSGNTGVGLAGVCASLGLRLIIVMPSSMSIERRKVMAALGAKIELTAPEKGMKGALERAEELRNTYKNSLSLNQFDNKANVAIHKETTAKEILESFKDTSIDIFVAGVGTGGSLTGIGSVLKEKYKDIHIVAVEPASSPVLSGGVPAPHKIQGIGAGFVPSILDTKIFNEILQVTNEEAFGMARTIASKEGLLVGISSGANVYAAKMLAKKYPNANILTMLNDTGERYLSTELFEGGE